MMCGKKLWVGKIMNKRLPKYKPCLTLDQSMILGRKQYVEYVNPAKNKKPEFCGQCDQFFQVTPYSSRCMIISFSELKEASINSRGRCKYFCVSRTQEEKRELSEKLPMTEDIKILDNELLKTVIYNKKED